MDVMTRPTDASVRQFLDTVGHPVRRSDAQWLDAMMRRVSSADPVMWGPSIVGYGAYRYRYASGHEGDMCRIGFSPRKANLSLYLLGCADEAGAATCDALLARLGKHRRGAGCLYVNKLADVDVGVLESLAAEAWASMERRYPST